MSESKNPTTDAYAAGLFDGEGTIYIDRNLSVRLEIQMTEPALRVLRWLESEYGGTVKLCRPETGKWAASYRWTQFSEPAGETLRRLVPWLTVKRSQAETALEALSVKPRSKQVRWTPEARAKVEALRQRMLDLNRKGPMTEKPDPDAPTNGMLIARLVDGEWISPQLGLFSDQGRETFSGPWPSSGSMTSLGAYSIPAISECPSDDAAFSSLADVLVADCAPRFFLSPTTAAGILRRAAKRGRELPPHLRTALSRLSTAGRGEPTTTTPRPGISSQVRRLTPTEGEE